ncbi:MAG TPA: CCA tRNA nucleotidyltransferase [Pelagibacterium sp.]|uniref:CCA tRNA nucleotidyltransferase n=1 Tax=Pelagibacterium sp. TaxID=1967288 RepID=UPI002C9513F1|nr:CCA tRNA nucleotidyltransferase [Pelagibacterium sp.]HWJ88591.1 CCA tRNA nucleotidyltransferase [Pelagibacterium sp.]
MTREVALARLAGAEWLDKVRPVFDCLGGGGLTRAVGGIVRDTLIGRVRDVADIDMATVLLPDEVAARGAAAGFAVHHTGVAHGTVTLVHGGQPVEVTTLRRDVETFGRHASVAFGTDWAEDARRRDFTMNALYCGPRGDLFDPLGGLNDCLAGRVRFIGDPDERIAEDRLRVYRYFRFAVSHGGERFEVPALAACARAVGTLDILSAERVGSEMMRLLAAPNCARTLETMREVGVLDGSLFSDSALTNLRALETGEGSIEAATRLAMVAVSGGDVGALRAAWRLSNATMARIAAIEAAAEMARGDRWSELAYRQPDAAEAGIAVTAAVEGEAFSWIEEAREAVTARRGRSFPITGKDLIGLGLASGPALGTLLHRLETAWIESDGALDREQLLEMATDQ